MTNPVDTEGCVRRPINAHAWSDGLEHNVKEVGRITGTVLYNVFVK